MKTLQFAITGNGYYPEKSTKGSAGYDLRLPENTTIAPGETELIRTGVSHACPKSYVGVLAPRSGLALKFGFRLFVSPALIDSDYRGEIKVLVENKGKNPVKLLAGERFAQITYLKVFQGPVEEVLPEQLSETTRGEGGFGSTGK